jgi:hypothetical protein
MFKYAEIFFFFIFSIRPSFLDCHFFFCQDFVSSSTKNQIAINTPCLYVRPNSKSSIYRKAKAHVRPVPTIILYSPRQNSWRAGQYSLPRKSKRADVDNYFDLTLVCAWLSSKCCKSSCSEFIVRLQQL